MALSVSGKDAQAMLLWAFENNERCPLDGVNKNICKRNKKYWYRFNSWTSYLRKRNLEFQESSTNQIKIGGLSH